MSNELLPIGVRRDGSYYTRVEWASHSEAEPLFWVNNVIDDDTGRSGGTWANHTNGPADCVLSFFGEEQVVSRVRYYINVGLPISQMEEAVSHIRLYISTTDEPRNLKSLNDKIDSVPWTLIADFHTEMEMKWQEYVLPEPVKAKYVRVELVKNFGPKPENSWTELSEIKFY